MLVLLVQLVRLEAMLPNSFTLLPRCFRGFFVKLDDAFAF